MRNALEKLSSVPSSDRPSVCLYFSLSISYAALHTAVVASSSISLSSIPPLAPVYSVRERRRPCHIQYSRIPLKDSIYFYS
jgi:hypothetical protein